MTGDFLGAILTALIVSIAVLSVAKRRHFFHLPPPQKPFFLPSWCLFGVYLAYFLFPLFVMVLLFGKKGIPPSWLGWLQLGALVVSFLVLILYMMLIPKPISRFILWGKASINLSRLSKDFGLGALAWIVSYPLVVFINLSLGLLIKAIWGVDAIEQIAVEQLKQTMDQPLLFISMTFAVIILVPCVEELLFRGFLQTWLRRFLNRTGALILASLIFSAVHFSPDQGMSNIVLLSSLFVLSCFLGFLYERQRTLWAPIGLHVTFNALSIIFIGFNT